MTNAMAVESGNDYLIDQDWSSYSGEEHGVWEALYDRRMRRLRSTASQVYLDGHDAIGLKADAVPNLAELNARLSPRTGWQAVAVTGFIPAHDFFAFLARKRFPTTITVRARNQMDY